MAGPSPQPPTDHESRPERAPRPGWMSWLVLAAIVAFAIVFVDFSPQEEGAALTYSEFLAEVDAGTIATVSIDGSGAAEGTRADASEYTTRVPIEMAGEDLLARLEASSVAIESTEDRPSFGSQLVSFAFVLLPVALLIGFFVWMMRRAGGPLGSAMGMGRSKAKVFDASRPSTTFDDVAGYEAVKAEIMEIADFLRDPERYAAAGAVSPHGVLMTGPPGTGKTLMARALAGEVGVPFLSVTGSSFVEMFVGVGAARVRDLFTEARQQAPAIIFVDEIDAIGQRRQTGPMISNDEREQTLNQLLAEMDGFDPSSGIIVLAATNRPEVLDQALLRPGRFDRQVMIPLPNQDERTAILDVHCRGKQLDPAVELAIVARRTPGFSGADLANLVNEAAIRAARDNRSILTEDDVETAYDRVLMGQRDGSNVLLPEERRAVATHEAGHAVVAALSANADPVHKVTILPAGQALGSTHQVPLHERHLYSENYLLDTLAVQLGGRAGELECFGQASTGAANDLASATMIATKMVKEYGLSPRLGPVGYPGGGPLFLEEGQQVHARPYSDQTQRVIDQEVSRLILEAQDRAAALIHQHATELEQIVQLLLSEESVEGSTVYAILDRPQPGSRPQVLTADDDTEPSAIGLAAPPLSSAVPQ